ncbi:MAG: hypothetical protein QM648_07195 [Solirubrobacterales bacterium]
MAKLEGLDDRALILEDGFLTVTRWADLVDRIPLDKLGETELVRDDKKKLFGANEERVRLRFGAIVTAIWLEADREQEAREFADAVDAARA